MAPMTLVLAFCLSLFAAAAAPPSEVTVTTVVVYLSDGSTLPLRAWAFSYEFHGWETGRPQGLPSRRESTSLWLGKRTLDVSGSTFEVVYAKKTPTDAAGPAKGFVLVSGKKKTSLKLDPPHRDLLLPGGGKGLNVMPTSIDFVGETLTGTRRQFCLAPFTALVDCAAAERVTKIEFTR